MSIWKNAFAKPKYGKITPRNYSDARRLLQTINKKSVAAFPEEEFWARNAILTYHKILDESEHDNEFSGNIKKSIMTTAKGGYFSTFLHHVLEVPVYQQRQIIINKLKIARAFLKLINVEQIENQL